MASADSLAFFQNFYTDVSLYVVAERATAPVASSLVTSPTEIVLPAVAPVAAVAPPTPPVFSPPAPLVAPRVEPAPAVVPIAAATPPVTPAVPPITPAHGKLPSLANLTLSPSPTTPVPPPVPTAPPAPDPGPLFSTPTLAELPAAPTAPASQPGRIQPTPTQSPVAHIPFATLGSNPNGLLILVRVSPDEFRKLPRNVFLNNILKAIRLVMEDVVLVNVEHEKFPVALCSLRKNLAAKQFLAFGKNLLDVAVYTTQPYEPVLLYGDTAFLGASEIKMLEYDAGRKKQLWHAMQRMFL
ncbi:hypothetical protein [Hymenobacter volaticus]|uniref:Uncharacterized protein n=1 Tax=Hymenobacter volaticus TaxID=2932254 RepID=A0ABY4GCB5_9BACT|nr:hypothetical protein [Hymenobacter volaticus]UOQ68543.1 hypothetical protein MUN86_12090 [Hymenobacter volaticus]